MTTEESDYIQAHVAHRSGALIDMIEFPRTMLDLAVSPQLSIAVPGGQDYTLVPIDDLTFKLLAEVYRVYKALDEPTRYSYVLQQRQDGLVKAVENMFGYNEFKRIETMQELAELVGYLRGRPTKHQPKIVRRHRLGPLGDRLIKDQELPDPEEEQR